MTKTLKELKVSADEKRSAKEISTGGLISCSQCDTPASASLSEKVGWIGCAPCINGEADSFDEDDLILTK